MGLPTLLFLWKMGIEDIKDKVRGIIEPLVNSLGVELDDLELKRTRGRALLRVFIDKDGGVTIDDCEHVSREVEALLDVEDPIPFSYVLEVSSPGLDRPVKGPDDFKRFSGKMVRVITYDPVEKQTFMIGKILNAGDDRVELLLPKDKKVSVSYKNISRARLEVEI